MGDQWCVCVCVCPLSIRTAMRHWASPEFVRPLDCYTDGVHYRGQVGFKKEQTGASSSGNPTDQLMYASLSPKHPQLVQWAYATVGLKADR